MDSFPKWARIAIFKRDGATCRGCRKKWDDGWMLECDHIIPLGNGGSNDISNGQLLCRPCHSTKHLEFSKILRKAGDKKGANAHAYWSRQIKKRDPKRFGF